MNYYYTIIAIYLFFTIACLPALIGRMNDMNTTKEK